MPLNLSATHPDTRPYQPEVLGPVIEDNRLPGTTFNNGLLRFHNAESGALAQENLHEFFGDRAAELTPFAVDWRGRHFCRVQMDGNDMALRTDSAFAEASPLTSYEDTIAFLLQSPDAPEFLEEDTMNAAFQRFDMFGIEFDRCLGLKIPAFLGGEETLENLDPSDMDVYWSFNAQIYNQVKDLPPGTPISDIKLG